MMCAHKFHVNLDRVYDEADDKDVKIVMEELIRNQAAKMYMYTPITGNYSKHNYYKNSFCKKRQNHKHIL